MKAQINRRKKSQLEQLVTPIAQDPTLKDGDRPISDLETQLLEAYIEESMGHS
jgi:hypothetical protein